MAELGQQEEELHTASKTSIDVFIIKTAQQSRHTKTRKHH